MACFQLLFYWLNSFLQRKQCSFYWLISLEQSKHLLVKSFMNGNARKVEGVSTRKTSKFECTIMENAKVRPCKFREILTLILWPFSKDYKFIA